MLRCTTDTLNVCRFLFSRTHFRHIFATFLFVFPSNFYVFHFSHFSHNFNLVLTIRWVSLFDFLLKGAFYPMANQPVDFNSHHEQHRLYQKHSKQRTDAFRQQSQAIQQQMQTSAESHERALAKEIAELKQLTKRHASK